jgi:hypothetical protein
LSNCEIEEPARFDLQFAQLQNFQITQPLKSALKQQTLFAREWEKRFRNG